jgi:aminoglycoside phosphotransferase (APT) family kinase protein
VAPLARCPQQGTFHRLYAVADPGSPSLLLRTAVHPGSEAAEAMALECRLMATLRERGMPVPTCEYRRLGEASLARGVQLVERVPGESLTALDDDEPRMLAALGKAAAFLARLHAVRGSGFGPLAGAQRSQQALELKGVHASWEGFVEVRLDEHVQACYAMRAIDAEEVRRIARHFEAARPMHATCPPALLHGDPGSHNFIFEAGELRGVIDWEDALLGDPLFELASLCTFHPERRHAAIWSAYGASLRGESWMRFWLYFLRIALAKTVHRRRFGYTDRPDRPPASRRIQLALERLAQAA